MIFFIITRLILHKKLAVFWVVALCSVVDTRHRLEGSRLNGFTIESLPEYMMSEPL